MLEDLISDCVDLFGYSPTDFEDMSVTEILDYLTDEQRKELDNYQA